MDAPDSTKQCSRCKDSKIRSEFSLVKRSKDGLQPWCKSCDAAYKTDSGYTKRLQELHKEKYADAFYRLAYSNSRLKRCPACGRRTASESFTKTNGVPMDLLPTASLAMPRSPAPAQEREDTALL